MTTPIPIRERLRQIAESEAAAHHAMRLNHPTARPPARPCATCDDVAVVPPTLQCRACRSEGWVG